MGCAVTQTTAGKDIAEIMAAVNWKSAKIARRYVGGARATRDATGTTPGAAEARYGAAKALAASVDPAVWALFPPRTAPPAGSRNHRRSPPLYLRFLHRETFLEERNFECTALGRLAAFIYECWGCSDHKGCDLKHQSGRRNTYRQERRASLGRVPPTDGGLVPCQTYKDLVACEDNTARIDLDRRQPGKGFL